MGAVLFQGEGAVVEAWHARANAERRTLVAGLVSAGALLMAAGFGGLLPLGLAYAAFLAVAVSVVFSQFGVSARAHQPAIEVFENGVRITQRRGRVRFQRFAPFPLIAHGFAEEKAPGRFHLRLTLLDGSRVESIPGEVGAAALAFIHERTGHQVRGPWQFPPSGANAGETHS